MGTIIKIKNCNCISDADIYLEENSLNIKYGSNGTGKSTVCKAIFAKASNGLQGATSGIKKQVI